MKKFITLFASLFVGAVVAQAAIVSTNNIAAGAVAVLPTINGGGALLSYVTITSSTTNAATFQIYDWNDKGLTNVIPAYTSVTKYATNAYAYGGTSFQWTNYYGVINTVGTNTSGTNAMNVYVSVLTTNAAATNSIDPVYTFSCGTNASSEFDGLYARFYRGIVIKNTTATGTASITVGYTQ